MALMLILACSLEDESSPRGDADSGWQCELASSEPVSQSDTMEWPEGFAEALDAYRGLTSASAQVECDGDIVTLDVDTFALASDDDIVIETWTGEDCESTEPVGRATTSASISLIDAPATEVALDTLLDASGVMGFPVNMGGSVSGWGVEMRFNADSSLGFVTLSREPTTQCSWSGE